MARVDNRIHVIKGDLSNMNDLDETYRELCSHYGKGLSKMKAFTKSQKVVNLRGLQALAIEFNALWIVDPMTDSFTVKYAPKDIVPLENTVEEEFKEVEPTTEPKDSDELF